MAREVNDSKPNWVITKVKDSILEITKSLKKETKDITIACLGLSFKANIDDLRESPALYITREISKFHDGEIIAVEPNIKKIQGERFKLESLKCAKKKADIILVLVDHDEFKKIESPNAHKIIDTRGVW